MKILILGGGYQQLPAIRKAHEMGLTVLLADYLADAPGRKKANQSFLISTRDKEEILELARREQVDGILAFASDPAAETATYVAEQLGLSGNPPLAAEVLGKALAEEHIFHGYRHLIGGDVIVQNGTIVLLGLMDCLREEPQNLVPCGKMYPCRAGEEVTDRIAGIVQMVIRKLSIHDAELNVEFIAGKNIRHV